MTHSSKTGFLFFTVSILSVLAFPCNPLVIFKILEPTIIKELEYVGWFFWVVGMVLVFLSYYPMYYRKVEGLVDSGIYAVVRHPMYLGWILSIFVATIFLYQHWLFVVIGFLGTFSLHFISIEEEHSNMEKFGDDYREYMRTVPRMNILRGILKKLA